MYRIKITLHAVWNERQKRQGMESLKGPIISKSIYNGIPVSMREQKKKKRECKWLASEMRCNEDFLSTFLLIPFTFNFVNDFECRFLVKYIYIYNVLLHNRIQLRIVPPSVDQLKCYHFSCTERYQITVTFD